MSIPYVNEPSKGAVIDWASSPGQAGLNPAYRLDHPMTLEGTVDGFFDMAVSGSSVNYWVIPPADEVYVCHRMLVAMVDADFNRGDRYGSTAGLTTGIAIHVEDDSLNVIHNFTPVRIKNITLWALLAGVDARTQGGAGADPYQMRWTMTKAGAPVVLDGRLTHRLKFEIPDNLGAGGAALDTHCCVIQGYRLKIPGATV